MRTLSALILTLLMATSNGQNMMSEFDKLERNTIGLSLKEGEKATASVDDDIENVKGFIKLLELRHAKGGNHPLVK
jgi:hypothetical protein